MNGHGASPDVLASVDDARQRLAEVGYLADEQTAVAAFLTTRLGKPILIEGPAGVGKTEFAKALAAVSDAQLIRLQCYEGIDEARALYECGTTRSNLVRLRVLEEHPVGGSHVGLVQPHHAGREVDVLPLQGHHLSAPSAEHGRWPDVEAPLGRRRPRPSDDPRHLSLAGLQHPNTVDEIRDGLSRGPRESV